MARSKKKEVNKRGDFQFVSSDNACTITFYVNNDNDTNEVKRICASINYDDAFIIKTTVKYNDDKAWLQYPCYKNSEDKYISLAYCMNKELIQEINKYLDYMLTELDI